MAKIDWPDVHYGFWVALGVIAAFMLLALVRALLMRVTEQRRNAG